MKKSFPSNLKVIYMAMTKCILLVSLVFAGGLFFVNPIYSASICLGVLFSGVSFYQFMSTQHLILLNKSKYLFFLRFLSRLGLYILPLGIGLHYKSSFNFAVILISLFTYQITFVLFEIVRNYKTFKRRRN